METRKQVSNDTIGRAVFTNAIRAAEWGIKIQLLSAPLSSVIIEFRVEIYGRFLVVSNIAPGHACARPRPPYGLAGRVVHKMQ